MTDKWIVKKVEYDNTILQLNCPYCGSDGETFFVHIEGPKPNYCPRCGRRLEMVCAGINDSELVNILTDVIKRKNEYIDHLRTQLDLTTEDKQKLAKDLLRKEEVNTELAAAVKTRDEQIASLKCQLDDALEEINQADAYYCSMIDNLRDDIQDLKQQLALSEASCSDAIKTKIELEEELFTKHNAYAELRHEYSLLNMVYEDMKKVMVKVRPSEWAAIAKKHNKEN